MDFRDGCRASRFVGDGHQMARQMQQLGAALILIAVLVPYSWAAGDATQAPPQAIDFYYNLYPEWKVQRFGAPSAAKTDVGTMGTLRNDTSVLSRGASGKEPAHGFEWSNSFVGVRGAVRAGDAIVGYDVQGL